MNLVQLTYEDIDDEEIKQIANRCEIYRAKGKRISICIDRETGEIPAVIKLTTPIGSPHINVVDFLYAADWDKRTRYDPKSKVLFLDAVAILDLYIWLYVQRDDWGSPKHLNQAFERLFGPGRGFEMAAMPKVAMAAALNRKLPGELEMMRREQIALRAGYWEAIQRGLAARRHST